ncbi:MAG: hypothetical protein HY741_12745 [Chloroflexi bacterium]|nr:hypothetical protein [Chloroflexota bacterium]
MVRVEQIAQAALAGDSLQTRSLAQDFLREQTRLQDVPRPETSDMHVLALSAGLVEMFASRRNQTAPAWTKSVGAANESVFLVKSALTMKHLRKLCETESPPPLRRRKFFAPPNYLEFA